MSDTYFRVYSGLLSPEHQEGIGKAIWTYLWLLDRITDEPEYEGERSGRVLHGRPVSYAHIGEELGLSKSTVKRQCESLQLTGYISMQITPRGNIFSVKRSKKWNGPDPNRAKNGTKRAENGTVRNSEGAINGTKRAINETNRAENGTHEFSNRAENGTKCSINGTKRAENDYSNINNINNNLKDKENKELKEAATNSDSMKIDLLNEFVRLRGSGFNWSPNDEQSASEIMNAGVPIEKAIELMQEMFSVHQPKHSRDRINSLPYCVGYILDKYQESLEPDQVPSGTAAELAEKFLQSMLKIMPDFSKPNMADWTKDMQRLLNEGKTPEKIVEVMEFAHANDFWQSKIITPAKLVEKQRFDSLAIERQKGQNRRAYGKRNERKDKLPKWLEEEKSNSNSEYNQQETQGESFEDMLKQLEESKRNRNEQHTH